MKPTLTIWVTTQFPGYHNWPDAPESVSFLKNNHRHLFHVKVGVYVKHEDRAIEFFMFKKYINKMIFDIWGHCDGDIDGIELGHKSCETLCWELSGRIFREGYVPAFIEISEDGENGARLEWKEQFGS